MSGRAEEITGAPVARGGARTGWWGLSWPPSSRVGGYAIYLVVLALLFIQPLAKLAIYAAHSELDSHILLVPFITAWLIYLRRGLRPVAYRSSIIGTLIACGVGIAVTAAWMRSRAALATNDELAVAALAFLSFVAAGGFLFLGSKWMAANAFPITFLIFMAPLPGAAANWLETVSMLRSADAADMFFKAAGIPLVRHGTVFELPGIVITVAKECSGIHSSWVLFITSLLTSHLFLKTTWRRIVLVAFVIPLGILRNGFRILVIGMLCVRIGPYMIDSSIHHRGGPVFFALSLIPLLLLILFLRRQEQRPKAASGT